MLLKIGELARRSGVTIRALRHYDEIGLLSPSSRSEGGFRLYGRDDVGKLYRIQALCRLNLSLGEIQQLLAGAGAEFPEVVRQRIEALDRQISQATALRDSLAELQARQRQAAGAGMDDWLGALAQMATVPRYFDSGEGPGASAAGAVDKAALTAHLRRLMDAGVPADAADAQELGYRWIELLLREVGNDEALLMKYFAMQWNEDALQQLSGVDRAGMAYIAQAMAHRRLAIYARYCGSDEMRRLRRHYVRCTTAWPPLICAMRRHMAARTPPQDPALRLLAAQWKALERDKTGGDPQLAATLRRAFAEEAQLRVGSGIDAPLLDYLKQALETPHDID